jgi:hypothetical protein
VERGGRADAGIGGGRDTVRETDAGGAGSDGRVSAAATDSMSESSRVGSEAGALGANCAIGGRGATGPTLTGRGGGVDAHRGGRGAMGGRDDELAAMGGRDDGLAAMGGRDEGFAAGRGGWDDPVRRSVLAAKAPGGSERELDMCAPLLTVICRTGRPAVPAWVCSMRRS